MADQPIENLLFDFLDENAAEFGESISIRPTPYEKRDTDSGIEIGDADSSMLPNGQEDEMTEFDGLLTIEIFSRVVGTGKTQASRVAARQTVFDIKKMMLQLFEEFPTLNGRACSVRVYRQVRFFDDTRADKYAIERVPININQRQLQGD